MSIQSMNHQSSASSGGHHYAMGRDDTTACSILSRSCGGRATAAGSRSGCQCDVKSLWGQSVSVVCSVMGRSRGNRATIVGQRSKHPCKGQIKVSGALYDCKRGSIETWSSCNRATAIGQRSRHRMGGDIGQQS
jgi:hypothetical protein